MLVYTRFYNEADDLLFVTRPVYNFPEFYKYDEDEDVHMLYKWNVDK